MNEHTNNHEDRDFSMPNDDLDALLRDWHAENAAHARARRAEVLRAVRAEMSSSAIPSPKYC